MTDNLKKTVEVWHLYLVFGLTLLSIVAGGATAWANINNRIGGVEDKAENAKSAMGQAASEISTIKGDVRELATDVRWIRERMARQ